MTKPRGCNLEKQADIWLHCLMIVLSLCSFHFHTSVYSNCLCPFFLSRLFLFHSPCLVISLPRFLRPLTVCWLNKWPSFILRERPSLMKTWSPCYGVILWSLCQRWMVFFSTSIWNSTGRKKARRERGGQQQEVWDFFHLRMSYEVTLSTTLWHHQIILPFLPSVSHRCFSSCLILTQSNTQQQLDEVQQMDEICSFPPVAILI